MSPPSEKVGGQVPRVPHQIAPMDVCSSTVFEIFFFALSCRRNGPRLLQNNWSQRISHLNTRGITNS